MKVRVKRDHMAYINHKRHREGTVLDIPEKLLKKADEAYAKKHGVKVGSVILPLWAVPERAPVEPEPKVPGSGQPEADGEGEGEESEKGSKQDVL